MATSTGKLLLAQLENSNVYWDRSVERDEGNSGLNHTSGHLHEVLPVDGSWSSPARWERRWPWKKKSFKGFFFSWHKLLQAGPECGCIWFKISLLYTASPKKRCLNWCYQPFGDSRRKQGGFVCAVFNWTDRTALPVLALDGIMLCCQGWDNTETGSCVSPSMSLCPWHESFLGFKKSHELLLTHNRLCSLNEKLDWKKGFIFTKHKYQKTELQKLECSFWTSLNLHIQHTYTWTDIEIYLYKMNTWTLT